MYIYAYIFQFKQFSLPDQKEIVLRKKRMTKDHLLTKCFIIKYLIEATYSHVQYSSSGERR